MRTVSISPAPLYVTVSISFVFYVSTSSSGVLFDPDEYNSSESAMDRNVPLSVSYTIQVATGMGLGVMGGKRALWPSWVVTNDQTPDTIPIQLAALTPGLFICPFLKVIILPGGPIW
jgi:hypothetical protein